MLFKAYTHAFLKTITTLTVLYTLFIVTSCSEEETPSPPSLSVTDFALTVDENQVPGTVLGTLETQANDGDIRYNILSQAPFRSLVIDNTTGEISVGNGDSFDYETDPVITATVQIMGNTLTETAEIEITLNDIDDIASALTASRMAYDAAMEGEWVTISETEYDQLVADLNFVTPVGTSDRDYDVVQNSSGTRVENTTWCNNNGVVMPSGSYVFAFKCLLKDASSGNQKVKQSSTSASSGFADLGGNLPAGVRGDNYFVLKGSTTTTTATGFLGYYDDSNLVAFKDIAGNSYFFNAGDVNELEGEGNSATGIYQGLSTTQKQW